MTGDVIKSFLVGLGFGVDDVSLAKFNKAIAVATLKVTALYASIKATSAAIVYGISKISEGFEQMGYEYRIIAPAINKALVLRRELLKAYSLAGINITKVIQSSVRLNLSLAKTRFAFEAIYRSVASRFFDTLRRQSDLFRDKIYANMPRIQAILERLVKFIFKALEATTTLGVRLWSILTRVYDFFVMLDEKTEGWSTRILAAIAIWKLLNLSFLATPLGILFTLALSLLALYDDFKTFKEGGQSLIDWGSDTTKKMVGVALAIGGVAAAIYGVITALKLFAIAQGIVNAVLALNPITLILGAVVALGAAIVYLDAKWKIFGGTLSGFFSGVGQKILDLAAAFGGSVLNFVGGVNPQIPAAIAAPGRPLLGSNVTNSQSQSNQHVQQQTNINVIGSADAGAVGKAVSSEQSKVNFDMVRNLRGATR